MKIAVHPCEQTFSARWIAYLEQLGIPFDLVDALADDVVPSLRGYDLLLWNWNLHDPTALAHARSVTCALESAGVLVFPDMATGWHYDDKVAQKFLLEAAGAPLIPTHVFFDEGQALDWLARRKDFPLVFKLSRGAGSYNVSLVRDRAEAASRVRRMFGSGVVSTAGYFTDSATKLRRLKSLGDVTARVRRLPASLRSILMRRRVMPRERGYVLFQDFVPGNDGDTRIVVIGGRAFGLRRGNRPGDFRASGSGFLDFDPEGIDPAFISCAHELSERLGFSCMAYDFLYGADRAPALVEISYCFAPGETYRGCSGYWDRDLVFHPGSHYMEDLILDDMLASVGGGR